MVVVRSISQRLGPTFHFMGTQSGKKLVQSHGNSVRTRHLYQASENDSAERKTVAGNGHRRRWHPCVPSVCVLNIISSRVRIPVSAG